MRDKAACLPRYKVDLCTLIEKPNHFVGRDSLLEELHETYAQGYRKVVLHAAPKMGKSALAQAYVDKYAESYFFIWWIDCSH